MARAKMEWEASEVTGKDQRDKHWMVEAIDHVGSGLMHQVNFHVSFGGPNSYGCHDSEALAKEYAEFKNSQPDGGVEQDNKQDPGAGV